MSGLLNSTTAISAALRIDWPTAPALPPADSGSTIATLTRPVPIADGAWLGWGAPLKKSPGENPVHAETAAAAMSASHACGLMRLPAARGAPNMAGLLRNRSNAALGERGPQSPQNCNPA